MNDDYHDPWLGTADLKTAVRGDRRDPSQTRLRLVHSRRTSIEPVRTSPLRAHNEWRADRHEKGMKMKLIQRIVHTASRFVFGLGVGVALTSAFVIVTSGSALYTDKAPPAVVRLDPVTVTISADAFEAARAEADLPPALVHFFGRGPSPV